MKATKQRQTLGLAFALVLALSLAMFAGSSQIARAEAATKITNKTTLSLKGKAMRKAKRAGVRITPVSPVKGGINRLVLPVSSVMPLGNLVGVGHKGGLRIKVKRRSVKLTGLYANIGNGSELSAQIGQQRFNFLRIVAPPAKRKLDRSNGSVVVKAAQVRLTPAAAKLLNRKLRTKAFKAVALGVINVSADVTAGGMPPLVDIEGPPTPGGSEPTARPAGAVDLTGGNVRWSPRFSWLEYLRQGEGPSAEGGAFFADNTYTFPITGGWYDPSDGDAVVETRGTSRFTFTGHFINVALTDWVFDLADTPKGVGLVAEAMHSIALPAPGPVGTRMPLMRLDGQELPQPTLNDGKLNWEGIPATLPNEAIDIFLVYPFGSTQGSVSVTAETATPAG